MFQWGGERTKLRPKLAQLLPSFSSYMYSNVNIQLSSLLFYTLWVIQTNYKSSNYKPSCENFKNTFYEPQVICCEAESLKIISVYLQIK